MRSKVYDLKEGIKLIELTDEVKKRLIVFHPDYELSYELMSVLLEDKKRLSLKDYISSLDVEKLLDYLQEINDDDDDYLFHDELYDEYIEESRGELNNGCKS